MKFRQVGLVLAGVTTFVALAGSSATANAESAASLATHRSVVAVAPSDLMGEYAVDVLEARRSSGIGDDVTELSAQQLKDLNRWVNAEGKYNELLLPAGGARASLSEASGSDYFSFPGPNQTAVCAANPIDCSRSVSARDDANNESGRVFPNLEGIDDNRDALRHCIWQALTTKRANSGFATSLGDAHEADGVADGSSTPAADAMDQANNATGREVGLQNENTDDSAIYDRCGILALTGALETLK